MDNDSIFQRTALVAGHDMMARLRGARVFLAGVGGVGSWCAEALVRTGIGHLTIIDGDTVAVSNINRQLPALTSTVGMVKTEVMARRLLDINPELDLTAIHGMYTPENADEYNFDDYDYVIDAIDSLRCKAALILNATASRATLFSSMGAARKLDASRIATAEFYKVEGCPLARALRQYFKRRETYPRRRFKCVYSPERIEMRLESADGANGTFAHTTAIFGMRLAGLVIEDIYRSTR